MKLIIALALALLSSAALAQFNNQTYYDASGNIVGRSTQSSSGQTTIYDANGSVVSRTQPLSDGTIVIYDSHGRRTGTISPDRKRK